MTDLPAATPGGHGLEKIHMTERAAMIAENPDGDVYKNERDLKSVLFKQEQMADEIAQKTAMVSDPDPLESLKDEYSVKDKRIRTRINELSLILHSLLLVGLEETEKNERPGVEADLFLVVVPPSPDLKTGSFVEPLGFAWRLDPGEPGEFPAEADPGRENRFMSRKCSSSWKRP
ncbi:unnamed protein product, partial [Notodromas monacha]